MSQTGQGWESAEQARERTRELVAGIYQRGPSGPPARTCPTCGFVAATYDPRCPECNKRYDRRLPWLKDWMRWVLGALLLAGAIVAALIITPKVTESRREYDARKAREQAARTERETARLIREQRPVAGTFGKAAADPGSDADPAVRVRTRAALVTSLEAAILADSLKRIAAEQMDGPVKNVICGPLIRNESRPPDHENLRLARGRYDCVAVKRDVVREGKVLGHFGHPFVATIDFDRGSYVFCKDNKIPGERGRLLAKVLLDPSCVGAENAERLGDGFILPEGE